MSRSKPAPVEITDEIRAGVLGAISRGMSSSYASRADGITVAQVDEIIDDAVRLVAVFADLPHCDTEEPCGSCAHCTSGPTLLERKVADMQRGGCPPCLTP